MFYECIGRVGVLEAGDDLEVIMCVAEEDVACMCGGLKLTLAIAKIRLRNSLFSFLVRSLSRDNSSGLTYGRIGGIDEVTSVRHRTIISTISSAGDYDRPRHHS